MCVSHAVAAAATTTTTVAAAVAEEAAADGRAVHAVALRLYSGYDYKHKLENFQ